MEKFVSDNGSILRNTQKSFVTFHRSFVYSSFFIGVASLQFDFFRITVHLILESGSFKIIPLYAT